MEVQNVELSQLWSMHLDKYCNVAVEMINWLITEDGLELKKLGKLSMLGLCHMAMGMSLMRQRIWMLIE
ncbi:hypothetical protein HJC23_001050 [Cyclotella cryptica]|uniref:Uncharacterized protein n=1 Tax=Cyclotella cryptica TaxID=29204 RepID=A0ABD3QJP1_9STRA